MDSQYLRYLMGLRNAASHFECPGTQEAAIVTEMVNRFYVNCPLQVGPFEIRGSEAHHLATVYRSRPGDRIYLFNGDGREYLAEVVDVSRRNVGVTLLESRIPIRELGFSLEIAAPLPKGDRAHFLIEKLTELGVTTYVPLRTDRSVVHPSGNRAGKLAQYVIEASKQCGRNTLLEVRPLTEWKAYCSNRALPKNRIMAHPGNEKDKTSRDALPSLQGTGPISKNPDSLFHDTVCAVGPEGGFTDEELGEARSNGWQIVSLGPRILRVETAAIVMACRANMPL